MLELNEMIRMSHAIACLTAFVLIFDQVRQNDKNVTCSCVTDGAQFILLYDPSRQGGVLRLVKNSHF